MRCAQALVRGIRASVRPPSAADRIGVVCGWLLLSSASVPALAAQDTVRVTVTGVTFDSIGMRPLAGAVVRIVRADDPSVGRSTMSDTTGAFRLADVGRGTWLATMLHPVLDSLRLEPGVIRLDLTESGEVSLPLATPSAASIAMATCRTALAPDEGILVGSVRDASTDVAVPLSEVEVSWPEFLLSGRSLTTVRRERGVRTDTLGRFAVCGVPRGVTVRARARLYGDSSSAATVMLADGGYGVQDFILSDGARDARVAERAPVRGAVVVRGRVTREDGTAVHGALVRMSGAGATVRSGTDGGFVISDAIAGTQTIEARMIGYTPHGITVQVKATGADDVALVLPVQRVQLDTVRVAATRPPSVEVRGIHARARSGMGRFFSGDVIRERTSEYVTDILRGMNGLVVTSGSRGNQVQMRNFGAREPLCTPFVYVDGALVQVGGGDPASVLIDDFVTRAGVSAMEVYARGSAVPPEFAGGNTGCGAIAVWSRRATGSSSVSAAAIDRRP